jgi:uncharacterized protein YqhQ
MAIKKTSIGGQALIEGIMMKGPQKTAMAVRKKDGSIDISEVKEKHLKDKYSFFGLPVIRGMVNLIESMVTGYKAMMTSADISGFTELEEEEERQKKLKKEQKKKEKALKKQGKEPDTEILTEQDSEQELTLAQDTKKSKGESVLIGSAMVIGTVLGVVLAVVLFMYLPALIFKGINSLAGHNLTYFRGVIEGVVKMLLFLGYLAAVSFEKDIKRVFMYHGAEHKTIFCYEKGMELTVENVKKQSRFHPRCGTSFMFLMLVIGILISSVLVVFLPTFITDNNLLWVPIKILLVPVICGLGYELIKVCGRYDNFVTRTIAAPGLWIQRLTTKEPDSKMIEIAIAAVQEVIPSDGSDEL